MTETKPTRNVGELPAESRQWWRYEFASKGLDFDPVEQLIDFRTPWWSWVAFCAVLSVPFIVVIAAWAGCMWLIDHFFG